MFKDGFGMPSKKVASASQDDARQIGSGYSADFVSQLTHSSQSLPMGDLPDKLFVKEPASHLAKDVLRSNLPRTPSEDARHHREGDRRPSSVIASTNEAGAGSGFGDAQHSEDLKRNPPVRVGLGSLCQQSLERLRTEEEEFRQWLRHTSARHQHDMSVLDRSVVAEGSSRQLGANVDMSSENLRDFRFSFAGSKKLLGTFQVSNGPALLLVMQVVLVFWLVSWFRNRSRRLRNQAMSPGS